MKPEMRQEHSSVATHVAAFQAQLAAEVQRLGRDPSSVTVVAVSKGQPAAAIATAVAMGIGAVGESYLQEALGKQPLLAHLPISWHFIGPIQRNKTRAIAAHFDWVHSVDRLEVARRLSEQRPPERGPLRAFIQVNVSGEASKAGVAPEEVVPLAQAMAKLPQIQLVGLMAIPEPSADALLLRQRFAALRALRDALQQQGMAVWALSMGMSNDWPLALAEGATHLRIGTALFGSRPAMRRRGEDAH